MATDQDKRPAPGPRDRRRHPDTTQRPARVDRRDVDDPDAWRRLVEILADLLYEPDTRVTAQERATTDRSAHPTEALDESLRPGRPPAARPGSARPARARPLG
jgi:hypothetical protein